MPAPLPPRPSLEWLRKTAKERLTELRAANAAAQLADAQLAVAHEYGFPSWRKLKAHVDRQRAAPPAVDEDTVAGFLGCVGVGRLDEVHAMLGDTPELVNAVGPHPFWGGRPQALHVAIEANRREVFDLLLARGAEVSGTNDQYDHWSPLMLAIARDRMEMRDELLRRGARVGLLEALMLADDARVQELLREENPAALRPNDGSILAFARTPYAIDRLLALGAPIDLKDRWGSSPVDAISRLGPRGRALVEHLVARGIRAGAREYARLGDIETLKRLVDADPSVARRDDVMMGAVDFGHHELVAWLLSRGGDVNARSDAESRHTALHSAAWNGDLRMVELLVEAGADRSIRDRQYDSTAVGWADTSIQITNNPNCSAVVAYLHGLESGSSNARPEPEG